VIEKRREERRGEERRGERREGANSTLRTTHTLTPYLSYYNVYRKSQRLSPLCYIENDVQYNL
jgi:hypothetical protein